MTEGHKPKAIYDHVFGLLTKLGDGSESVGLHYTGGTKLMAAHAHRAASDSKRKVQCSYLDAQTLSLIIDGGLDTGADLFLSIRDEQAVSLQVHELMSFNLLQTIRKTGQVTLTDVGTNYVSVDEANTQLFEFDVAATRGYRLFALSCTASSDKDLCKSKLFEAFHRARQMGGDEARVALLCGLTSDKARDLLRKFRREFYSAEGAVHVFTIEQLKQAMLNPNSTERTSFVDWLTGKAYDPKDDLWKER